MYQLLQRRIEQQLQDQKYKQFLLNKWDFIRDKKRLWEQDALKLRRARKVKQFWALKMQTKQILAFVYHKFETRKTEQAKQRQQVESAIKIQRCWSRFKRRITALTLTKKFKLNQYEDLVDEKVRNYRLVRDIAISLTSFTHQTALDRAKSCIYFCLKETSEVYSMIETHKRCGEVVKLIQRVYRARQNQIHGRMMAYQAILFGKVDEMIQAEQSKQKKKGAKKNQTSEQLKELQRVANALPHIALALKRLNQIREKMTLLAKLQKTDDRKDESKTIQMHIQQGKLKEICQNLLDHLIDDQKVKIEIVKETLDLKPIEITKHIQFILRSIFQQRFLNLVIKKFQSAASE